MRMPRWLEHLMFKRWRCQTEEQLPSVDELYRKVASSEAMANNAERKLNRQKARGPEVRRVSKSLNELRLNNHFAESIERSLRRSHQ